MLPLPVLLISLLMGSVEVHAAPYDKGSRQEEMMTRCIIEVLSNALSKPNAPPIDPECKEILKKSNRHNQVEEEDELNQYVTRTIKDPVDLDNHQHDSKEEAKKSPDPPKEDYEEKRHHAETESRKEKEEEKVKEDEKFDEKEEITGHSRERSFAEDEDDDEERDHKEHYEKEDMEKRHKYHEDSQESTNDVLDKRAHHTTKHTEELPEEENEDNVKNLEEILKRHAPSKNWKEPLLQPANFHSSKVPEENNGWEEEKEKISYKPNREQLIKRLFGYEERQGHHEEPRNNFADPRGQKPHFGETSLENHLINNYFDKRSHYDKESLEEAREKKHHHQDSEEEADHHDSSEESNEKEPTDHHYEEKRRQEERKRWPGQQNSRLNYEESNEDSEESEEGIDKRHEHEQEKENFYRKLKNHLQESEEAEPFRQEKKQEEKRYYIGEEMVDGMKRYYPKLPQEKDLRQYEESKSRHIREDREDSNYPDIDTYTCLWGKKKFLEDLRRRYGGNRNAPKMPKLEEKREYDRMDELAQLLNYKKKSVEFPDFYDSEEIKKRHYDERWRFRETPLTEEEEKELENLAMMDMELQKIAEKLSNNRQG